MEAKDLIKALIAAGWTQAEIAERIGIQQPSISKVISGTTADIMSRHYRRLLALHARVCKRRRNAVSVKA